MQSPLDFENEDRLFHAPRLTSKRRKVIGLDDLLSDFYGDKNKSVVKSSKHLKAPKGYDSDEDDKRVRQNETYLQKFVEDCEKQVKEIGSEDEVPIWGRRAFGIQKTFPSLEKPLTANSDFFECFSKAGLASSSHSNVEELLQGLLTNGWLSHLVTSTGSLEDSIAAWTFHTMLYSSEEDLHVSACDFWCSILLSRNEGNQPLAKLGWIPSYSVLKDAISDYGYLWPTFDGIACEVPQDYACEGPPLNICSWIRALSACCQIRSMYQIFSTSEMEELLEVVIWFFLDRHLLGLTLELNGCLHSAVHYFVDVEWENSCAKVAGSIAQRVPKDLNCLRVVESITGTDSRSKYFRSQLALHLLVVCFDNKVKNVEEILKLLASVNLKETSCDFFKLYVYLNLMDNLLLVYHPFQEKSKITDLWCKFLRNCTSQITCTDWRSYASKVRNKASYLLQNMTLKISS
ncbi:hypothetical protein LUZ62_018199 [Rhynchospora pubera]|uniref:Coiled-coil SMC6 And NSE5 INteracting (CANIN) domain-containing protein n=1 Tax=Rhynchospora pubera TaxID=906938 RepID=A0AAV8GIZ1_9POAL|nr:hypothetical protein LUZ62_004416 [Rhynchospora pubera]KAJ4778664.1 hypothetical protein LUZ62_062921 [Rhynchospora pubera]KAJ4805633.1 hypothetical protein LUZ62_018199 [Rhynchospora pubera]